MEFLDGLDLVGFGFERVGFCEKWDVVLPFEPGFVDEGGATDCYFADVVC